MKKLYIDIVDGSHITWWGVVKTYLWNFILPPHIKISIKDDDL